MASQKITDSTSLLGIQLDRANDVLPIVDVSAGTSGNKKITPNDLFTGTPATSSRAGSMTAVDKAKLDAINTDLIVNTNSSQIITGQKTLTSFNFSRSANKLIAPAANTTLVYGRDFATRVRPVMQAPDGREWLIQAGMGRNHVCILYPSNGSTAPDTHGMYVTNQGTISHPSPTDDLVPYMTNYATAATGEARAGSSANARIYCRGSNANGFGGFSYFARLYFPDASYTNCRILIGLNGLDAIWSDGSATATSDIAGNYAAFQYSTSRGDTTWMFVTKDGTTQNVVPIVGATFTPQKMYDFYIECPRAGTSIGYRIDNLTDGLSYSGSTSNNLPTANAYMNNGFQLRTTDNVARNIRMYRMYTEQ
ncbi:MULTISPECIES: hypothetical protein [Calothrix]|uniref:Tail fiber protein n=2 Tax=Calothrix TaxID=1186 RepID=A0ABR8AKT9_9CYAN|nr:MULTISPECIES: hypothetical protein [Calothrix]MBD2200145.1 hypothetical protein [Calothrix parietina FACHB-288]MBD2229145.1 hypothetical protein [Calothrix anomala FACHB-343]